MYAGIKCILKHKNCFNFVYNHKCLIKEDEDKKQQKKRKQPGPNVSRIYFLVVGCVQDKKQLKKRKQPGPSTSVEYTIWLQDVCKIKSSRKKRKQPGPSVSRIYFLVVVHRMHFLQRRNAERAREVDEDQATLEQEVSQLEVQGLERAAIVQ